MGRVLQETNLNADVLRAWERRYGLPNPQRTPGGHRLYSDYDIEVIKWLLVRQSEGLSISNAADLWKSQIASGQDPLLEKQVSLVMPDVFGTASPSQLDHLREEWVNACLNFDSSRAFAAASQAFVLYPVETACDKILREGICEIGHLWYEGKISVQQEHFATALAIQRVGTLISTSPEPTRPQTILIGCPPGEWHSFPALFLTLLLRRRGFKVVYLDANVPVEQMGQTIAAVHPDLIILTAQQLSTAVSLQQVALLLGGVNIPLGYGGLVFNRIPSLRTKIPASFLGEDLMQSIETIELLLQKPTEINLFEPPTPEYLHIAALYTEHQSRIETVLGQLLAGLHLNIEPLNRINTWMSAALSAALKLGNLDFLQEDLNWIGDLITFRQITTANLKSYLESYRQAVEQALGENGTLLTDWFELTIASYSEPD